MRRISAAFLPLAALSLAACSDLQTPSTPSAVIADGAMANSAVAKVSLCHRSEETNSYILISIAPAAVPAHLAHGDGQVGDPVPGQPGKVFGADCVPQLAPPFVVGLSPSASGYIRDANLDGSGDQIFPTGLIQIFKTPDYEERGIFEFDLTGIPGPVGHARLSLYVQQAGGAFVPLPLGVFAYAGDGALTLADFAAGTQVASIDLPNIPLPPPATLVTIDVTAGINSLIAAHAHFAGLNLRILGQFTHGAISLFSGTLVIQSP